METYLHGLLKATNYSIRVLAFTSSGDGLHSIPVYCSTDEDVPDAPASIKASALTAESILISWLPPTQRNGLITHYTVYSKEAGRKGQTRSKIKRWVLSRNPFSLYFSIRQYGARRWTRISGYFRGPQPRREPKVWFLGYGIDVGRRRGTHVTCHASHKHPCARKNCIVLADNQSPRGHQFDARVLR